MATVTYSNIDEHRFWLQIMGDNALLLLDAIHTDDTAAIQQARSSFQQFESLLSRAKQNLTPDQLSQLNQDAYSAVQAARTFYLKLLKMQLTENYFIFFKPTILNNMVTIAEQYMYLLGIFMRNHQPSFDPKAQDIFWLPIFITQAKHISDSLGFYEVNLRERAQRYATIFQNYLSFAIELQGLLRIDVANFPLAYTYRQRLENTLRDYAGFLVELILTVQQNGMPGTLSVLYLDRSYRLICYYLTKLTILADTEKPACYPNSTRLSTV